MDQATTLQELVDRQEIHSALLRYARGVDRLDEQLIASAYHPDAADYRGGSDAPGFVGSEAGSVLVERLRATCDTSFHALSNVLIELDGDSAHAESYFQVWQAKSTPDGPSTLHVCGRYVDRFERRDGDWRIARREAVTDFAERLGADGTSHPLPITGRRSPQDASYQELPA
jgi:hypothetical protein